MATELIRLAKAYAEVRGYQGRCGGWIYSPKGRHVAKGWEAFALHLRRTGRIVKLDNDHWAINWMADHR